MKCQMIDFITLILSLSMTATLLFGVVRILDKVGYPISGIYILEKVVCIFYLLPSIIIIGYGYFHFTKNITTSLQTEDFYYISYEGYLSELSMIKQHPTLQNVYLIVAIIWGLGFLGFFVVDMICSTILLKNQLKQCERIDTGPLLDLMYSIKKDLKIKRGIQLYQSWKIDMPFTTGIFNIRIVLPHSDNSAEVWDMLLRHELIHCKRHDVFLKILVRFVQKIHWFNPFIFLFSKRFCEECEYTCDMEVVKDYDRKKCIQYGELIIRMAEERPLPKFTLGFSENNYAFVEKRLNCLMKKSSKKVSRL